MNRLTTWDAWKWVPVRKDRLAIRVGQSRSRADELAMRQEVTNGNGK